MRARVFLFAIALLPLASAAALGPRYGGALSVGLAEIPPSADLLLPHSSSARLLAALTHDTAVRIGPDGELRAGLVSRWTPAASGREWTLSLAPGLRFHDGALLEARDLARSLRRFLRAASMAAEALAASLEGGAEFRAGANEELGGLLIRGSQVVLRLVGPRALPLAALAASSAAVTGTEGAGCGPFVPTLPIPGRRLGLTAFGSHVRGRPFLDRVELRAIDLDQRRALFQSRQLDALLDEAGEAAPSSTLLLWLDPSRPPFDQPQGRQAVAAWVESQLLAGISLPVERAMALLPSGLLPWVGAGPRARAEPHLAASISLAVGRDVAPALSQRLVAILVDRGLQVEVLPVDPARAPAARAQARLFVWTPEVAEAGLALRELAAWSPAPEVRATLEAAESQVDHDRRRGLLQKAEIALREEAVLVPLAGIPVSLAVRPGVHGVRLEGAGTIRLEDSWTEP